MKKNCALCQTELYRAESHKFGLCFECRHFPGQASNPQTEQQHDNAVRLFRKVIKSIVGEQQ